MIDLEKIKKEKKIEELINFGIINIDKPSGPTSFWVDTFIMRKLGLSKASHTGTLDPKVTGVLPILLGRACRLLGYFKDKKEYVGIMRIHKEISEERLKEEMKKFQGKIKQLPPIKSRVKREIREREVYRFELLEKEENDVLFVAEVEAGTYIRKICSDLGLIIGGAHMAELRRTQAGIFKEPCINLYDFEKAVEEYKSGNDKKLREMIIPGEIIGNILPVIQVKEESLKRLYTGSPLFRRFLKPKQENILNSANKIAVFCKDRFIETARKAEEGEIIARPEFVLN